jgi:DNA (cytosine-5)-methyltransferase 1
MMLENVEEFRTWGPLLAAEMRPDPERVGETFNAFVSMLSDGISADHPALAECCEFLNIEPGASRRSGWLPGWVMRSNIVSCAHAITARRRSEKDFSW